MKKKGTALAILMSLAMVFAMMPMMAGAAYADSEVVDAGIKYTLHDNGEATVSGYTDAIPDNVLIPATIRSGDVDYPVTSIGDHVFYKSSNLRTVTFEEGSKLETIGISAFYGTRLTSITIPESVTSIGDSAFRSCPNLRTISFAEGSKLESIGVSVFWESGLTSITIPENVTTIGDLAFYSCYGLGTVTFAEGSKLKRIGEGAFYESGLTSIILPEGITVLPLNLFGICYSLKEVSLPSTVYEIQTGVFDGCNKLNKIYFGGSTSQWDAITGDGKPAITPILCVYAPAGKSFIYNGEVQTGVDSDTRYTLSGTASAKAAGSYQATATLNDAYVWAGGTTDPKTITWTIDKADNPLSIKGRTVKVKYKKLKKKNQKLAVTKVIKFTKKGQGKMTYTKASGKKKITINKKTGKVTVKKGLKKGTYKVKVKVKAAGNANHNASTWKTATFKIKVK